MTTEAKQKKLQKQSKLLKQEIKEKKEELARVRKLLGKDEEEE